MIYLRKFNETVWSGRINPDDDDRAQNSITGGRQKMCLPILDTLDDLNLTGGVSTKWTEPAKRYDMSYEMAKSRIVLSVDYTSKDFTIGERLEDILELKSQLIGSNIGILSIKLSFHGVDTVEMLSEELDNVYFIVKNLPINYIYYTFKLFDDISEYNDDYIKNYLDLLG